MVNLDPNLRAAAFAWFDLADQLWRQLPHAPSDEEFRRIAREHADATLTGLELLNRARRPTVTSPNATGVGMA